MVDAGGSEEFRLAQLATGLLWYHRGQGSILRNPQFSRLSFHKCVSCMFNCHSDDFLYIHLNAQLHVFSGGASSCKSNGT